MMITRALEKIRGLCQVIDPPPHRSFPIKTYLEN